MAIITVTAGGTYIVNDGDVFIIAPGFDDEVKFEAAFGEPTPADFEIQFNVSSSSSGGPKIKIEDDNGGLSPTVTIAENVIIGDVEFDLKTAEDVDFNAGDNVTIGMIDGSTNFTNNITFGDNGTIDEQKIDTTDGDDFINLGDDFSISEISTGEGSDNLVMGEDAYFEKLDMGSGSDTAVVGGIDRAEFISEDKDLELTGGESGSGGDIDVLRFETSWLTSAELSRFNAKLIDVGYVLDPVTSFFSIPGSDPEDDEKVEFELDNGKNIKLEGWEQISLVICFGRGTLISTDRGMVAIEKLDVGNMVLTKDNGFRPICWIGNRALDSVDLAMNPKLFPVRITAGALGKHQPQKDLMVSPQHRVLVRSKIAERMFNTQDVLIPAIKLCALDGIEQVTDAAEIEYWHMLFDCHEIVYSNGAATESLFTGPEALKSISAEARMEIMTLFPAIAEPGYLATPARYIPAKGKLMTELVARHNKNAKALLVDVL